MKFRRPRRFGLRARITLAFALGSLLLSVTLSTSTWAFTRQSQLNLRETSALDRLFTHAQQIRLTLLAGGGTDMREYIDSLPTPAWQVLVVASDDGPPVPFTTSPRLQYEDLHPRLREFVEGGEPGSMLYRIADEPVLAVGVPLPAARAQYYEVVSLAELERSLDLLAYYLAAASLVTTAAGGMLGWWASRRTLLPLTDVGVAAEAIAGGRLDTRLEVANDPDLAVLVSSFNEMAEALQARIERDARFASDVSHELRSPLMTLAASIEVLETRRDELPDRSRAALDLLVDDVNRFQQLVADLLEISRFDSGAAHLQLEPVHLAEFLAQAIFAATHEPVPLITDPSATDTVVQIDKRRAARVIANLVDNARKYGGGATAVRLRRLDHHVEVVVEDSGDGVAPEDQARIFERFSRGGSAGSRGTDTGSGLGLALVAEHVRLHGGSVRVENRTDGHSGARFVVTLPVGQLPASDEYDDMPSLDLTPHT
ncbi:MAG: sensor histidine kinase [Acidimicrobiales bacterium]